MQKFQAITDQFEMHSFTFLFQNNPKFRKEMARSIDYLAEKKAVKEDYQILFKVFLHLLSQEKFNEKTITAFLALYWEMKPTSSQAKEIINDLLKNPSMTAVMAAVAEQGFEIGQLYATREKNEKIIQALDKITQAIPASQRTLFYELAMKDEATGSYFRQQIDLSFSWELQTFNEFFCRRDRKS